MLDAANMIAYLFSGLLLPMFSHMIKRKQPLEELVSLSFSFIAIPAVIVISFCMFYAHEVMDVLYHAHVEESAAVLQLVISCFLAISSVYIFGTLLTANGNLRQLNKVALSGMVLNIVLNLILIPRLEARGAAFSSLITQYLTAGMQVWLAHKIFHFHFKWKLLLRYLAFAAGTLYLYYLSTFWGADWFLNGLLAGVASLIMAFSLYLIRPIGLMKLVRAGEEA
jgi:O-antigen/teichoic acid export membrane protein